jgi:hypothetical protein
VWSYGDRVVTDSTGQPAAVAVVVKQVAIVEQRCGQRAAPF